MSLAVALVVLLFFTAGCRAASEVDALLAFKRALTIPPEAAGFFATWDATATTPCSFSGVACNLAGRVTAIHVWNKSVAAASVPWSDICGALPRLVRLDLQPVTKL
ncbi:hypothetical protein ACP4OV_018254 [Aristida adscensionis]